MKLAFIDQPFGPISLPINSGSLSIWLYQVVGKLSEFFEITVYAKHAPGQPTIEHHRGVCYKRISVFPDHWLLTIVEKSSRFRPPSLPVFTSAHFYRTYIKKVARDLRQEGCDIVFLFNFAQYVPIIRAYNPRIKIVLNMQCEWLTQLDRSWVAKRIKEADLILGCSDYITEKIKQRFPEFSDRCATVYNGVNVDHFETTSQSHESTGQVLFVGRVSPEKGVHVLVDAFQRVVRYCPRAQLNIIGPEAVPPLEYIVGLSDEPKIAALAQFYNNGSYVEQLRSRAKTLGITDQVRFAGRVPHEELVKYYQNADLLVNPSFSESFGMTLVEAMASELPVIGSRVGGMREIVDEGRTGLLAEAGDVNGLAEAMVSLLKDDRARSEMARLGRKKVVELFSWDRVAESLLRSYHRIEPRVSQASRSSQ